MAFPPPSPAPSAPPAPNAAAPQPDPNAAAAQVSITLSQDDIAQLQMFADFLQGILGQVSDSQGQAAPDDSQGGDNPLAGLGAELDQMSR